MDIGLPPRKAGIMDAGGFPEVAGARDPMPRCGLDRLARQG